MMLGRERDGEATNRSGTKSTGHKAGSTMLGNADIIQTPVAKALA
jgi:hypothetical protein